MDMLHFSQWWKRSIQSGWPVAEGVANYGSSPETYMVREHCSGWLWGLLMLLLAIALVMITKGISLGVFLLYPLLAWRIYQYRHQQRGDGSSSAFFYAFFCTLSKFPQMIGQGPYWLTRWQGKTATLIEYKSASKTGVEG